MIKKSKFLCNSRIKYFQKLPLQQDAETKAASKCSLKKFNMQNLAYLSGIPQKVHAASDWLRPFWPWYFFWRLMHRRVHSLFAHSVTGDTFVPMSPILTLYESPVGFFTICIMQFLFFYVFTCPKIVTCIYHLYEYIRYMMLHFCCIQGTNCFWLCATNQTVNRCSKLPNK